MTCTATDCTTAIPRGHVRAAERELEDAQDAARTERQAAAPTGADAGRREAARHPALSPALADRLKAAETEVNAAQAALRVERQAQTAASVDAARAEARRRAAATKPAETEAAPTEAAPGSTSAEGRAEGRAEAQRRIAARSGRR